MQEGLKEKLGPVLFQLPARITYSEDFLQRITENVSAEFINVIEFRHLSWWNQHIINQLSQHNISFCGIDIQDLPDDIVANTSTVYYRFHGQPKLYYSEYQQEKLAGFSNALLQKAANKTAYIYFNNTATIAAINNAIHLQTLLLNQ